MSTTKEVVATVALEPDGSYSIGIEDGTVAEDSDERYITGLSEGQEFDAMTVGGIAGRMIAECLSEGPMRWRNSTTGAVVA